MLHNGIHVTGIALSTGENAIYTITIPENQSILAFRLWSYDDEQGDADIYVRRKSEPTIRYYDAKSNGHTNAELILFQQPEAGTYYLMIDAYRAVKNVSLVAQFK